MTLIKDAELIDVVYKDDNNTVVLSYLSPDTGELYEIKFHKQRYDRDSNTYVDDPDQLKKVEKQVLDNYGVDFDRVSDKMGEKRDIYHYDNFDSLWEVDMVNKFDPEKDAGELFETKIDSVKDDGVAIRIGFQYNEKPYESKMSYSTYNEARHQYFPVATKKTKRYEDFEKKFGVSVDKADSIIGKNIMVEVKKFGKFAYADVKKLKK